MTFGGKKYLLILKLHLGESTQSFCMLHSSMLLLVELNQPRVKQSPKRGLGPGDIVLSLQPNLT